VLVRGLDLLRIREDLSPRKRSSLVRVARVGRTWGVHGHLIVRLDNPESEQSWCDQVIWLRGEAWPMAPVEVNNWLKKGAKLLIQFAGVSTPEEARAVTGLELWVPRENLAETLQNEHYVNDLLGMRVVDEKRGLLGHIAQVFPAGGADIWVVRGEQGESMIPAVRDFIRSVDLQDRVVQVAYPEPE
tara:strand:- start:5223 stop:5783 length:561 start_codon:yes stop_codon:yes gene_type:complete